jgi:hypothetical protein
MKYMLMFWEDESSACPAPPASLCRHPDHAIHDHPRVLQQILENAL